MTKGRLEAFSDAVIAIVMTIMVLELKVPHGTGWGAIEPLIPVFLAYVLSFIYLGIYWNNHHHMFHLCDKIGGGVLWPNLHLLFWLSLVPFATGWMGENHVAPMPTAFYGLVLLMAAAAWSILQSALLRQQGPNSKLRAALGRDFKAKISLALYVASVPLAFVNTWISVVLFIAVALIWLVPDRRMEAQTKSDH